MKIISRLKKPQGILKILGLASTISCSSGCGNIPMETYPMETYPMETYWTSSEGVPQVQTTSYETSGEINVHHRLHITDVQRSRFAVDAYDGVTTVSFDLNKMEEQAFEARLYSNALLANYDSTKAGLPTGKETVWDITGSVQVEDYKIDATELDDSRCGKRSVGLTSYRVRYTMSAKAEVNGQVQSIHTTGIITRSDIKPRCIHRAA